MSSKIPTLDLDAKTMSSKPIPRCALGISASVLRSVPKRGPSPITPHPTPTKLPIKTGLKSSI
jgi:hypothetical protein